MYKRYVFICPLSCLHKYVHVHVRARMYSYARYHVCINAYIHIYTHENGQPEICIAHPGGGELKCMYVCMQTHVCMHGLTCNLHCPSRRW